MPIVRSIDCFADIDGLLSGDLTDELNSATVTRTSASQHFHAHPDEIQQQQPQRSLPEADFTSHRAPIDTEQPAPATPARSTNRFPVWLQALLGIGITAGAVGGGLLWLISERKIELPKNIDTSWLPFQSKSQVSPEDAKFAEYMQKSITNIESAKPQSPIVTNPVEPTNNLAAPASLTNPTGTLTTAPSPATVTASPAPIALLKTFPTSGHPKAVFKLNDREIAVNVGQKIGTSNWSLLTVAKGEVILKKVGGEIRSIYVGQKF